MLVELVQCFQLIQLTHWKRATGAAIPGWNGACFQLIQLTHWKRVSLYGVKAVEVRKRFQLIQLTHWKRGAAKRRSERSLVQFPTNPINALEASQSDLIEAAMERVSN